jgi:hypothetical protein
VSGRSTGKSRSKITADTACFFPAELEHLIATKGFFVHGIWDNKELNETDLLGVTLYVAASYRVNRTEWDRAGPKVR